MPSQAGAESVDHFKALMAEVRVHLYDSANKKALGDRYRVAASEAMIKFEKVLPSNLGHGREPKVSHNKMGHVSLLFYLYLGSGFCPWSARRVVEEVRLEMGRTLREFYEDIGRSDEAWNV